MEENLASFLYACLDPSQLTGELHHNDVVIYLYLKIFRLNPKELLNHAYLCGVSIPVYKKVRKYCLMANILFSECKIGERQSIYLYCRPLLI